MQLDHWFPSTIGRSYHPEWIETLNILVDEIFKDPNKEVSTSFYYNGETTYGVRSLFNDPKFSRFGEFVLEKGKEFLNMQGYDPNRVNWRPYMFANSFLKGSNHPKHLHSQCTLSGIFYLKIPEGSSNITFYPNQPFKDFFDYMYAIKDPTNWYSLQSTTYVPQPGMLLIWPAWLYHEVVPNNSEEPRTSVVFNL